MKMCGSLKTILFLSCLSLSCNSNLASPPPINQCQFNGTPLAFFCENTDTHVKEKIELTDPRMKAAQCVSADDFKTMQTYVEYLMREAERRCR